MSLEHGETECKAAKLINLPFRLQNMVDKVAWAHEQLLDEQLVDPQVVSLLQIVDVSRG